MMSHIYRLAQNGHEMIKIHTSAIGNDANGKERIQS